MLMSKNVNNDVSKDSPIEDSRCLFAEYTELEKPETETMACSLVPSVQVKK